MKLRAVYSSREDPLAADALDLSAEAGELPDRLFAIGAAGRAVAARVEEQQGGAGDRYVDDVAAYLLEGRTGPPPRRTAGPAWLERLVIVTDDDDGLGAVPHARRGLELLGRLVVMVAPSRDALEEGELPNAHVWLFGGGDMPTLEADEGRALLAPGDLEVAGGVLDLEIRRGLVTATVTRDGDELASFEHQLKASTKMSVRG